MTTGVSEDEDRDGVGDLILRNRLGFGLGVGGVDSEKEESWEE